MKTVTAYTLGCKVNQYDTQAMLELLYQDGWTAADSEEKTGLFLVNTCTVTGVGDKKSLQLVRRLRREHPGSFLVVCGCLAQYRGEKLFESGADLVIGTQRRNEIVSLLNAALTDHRKVCAVEPIHADMPFERLSISTQSDHTRAVLKIQEGCNNHCTYCIIPSVRGPIRSRSPEDIRNEASRLSRAGFREIVLTGIHLTSYGRDLPNRPSLLDAVRIVSETKGILRVRLGSLEPTVATLDFAKRLSELNCVCPHFHLALQSGSDTVLARMKRRYNTGQYLKAVENLRSVFPRAALTTDVLTGFPGETSGEFEETCSFIRKVGFSRIHVFPYSQRPGTEAASMAGQLSRAEKECRARKLIAIGSDLSKAYRNSCVGLETEVLPEEKVDGSWTGYTPEYIRVYIRSGSVEPGSPLPVKLVSLQDDGMAGIPL